VREEGLFRSLVDLGREDHAKHMEEVKRRNLKGRTVRLGDIRVGDPGWKAMVRG